MSPKNIKKLADKKYRTETGLFLVEGEKSIKELLSSDLVVEEIHGTNAFIDSLGTLIRAYERKHPPHSISLSGMNEEDLVKIGTLQSNNAGIAVVQQKRTQKIDFVIDVAKKDFVLALSDIRDPGNLGTIIRIADWFGVKNIVASPTTTDSYNPKAISASMGSFTRVDVTYIDLGLYLKEVRASGSPIIGAVFDGKNINEGGLSKNGVLVMGSESHGIEGDLLSFLSEKLTIPKYGEAESLNVSIATGVLLNALRAK